MIHYHGTPCGATREDVARFLAGRHALIPWLRPEDIGTAAEVCQSFAIDCSAYTAWKSGAPITDWSAYYEFVETWRWHPAFDWAAIPDVIDGSEEENDALINEWPHGQHGLPTYHIHESLDRLKRLVAKWPHVGLGSSGVFASPGSPSWWRRMNDVMAVCCDNLGRPKTKFQGWRMLDPDIFTRLPLASADSTNAVRNSSSYSRFGMYCPPNASTRMAIIAERIEQHQSASLWVPSPEQKELFAGAPQ